MLLVTHDLRESAYLANRICVMSSRPGRILETRDVGFARPRTLESSYAPEFATLVQQLRMRIAEARRDGDATPPPVARRDRRGGGMNALSPVARQRLLSAGALVGFFVLWEIVCLAFGVSDLILPRPSQIAAGADREDAAAVAACAADALHHLRRLRASACWRAS